MTRRRDARSEIPVVARIRQPRATRHTPPAPPGCGVVPTPNLVYVFTTERGTLRPFQGSTVTSHRLLQWCNLPYNDCITVYAPVCLPQQDFRSDSTPLMGWLLYGWPGGMHISSICLPRKMLATALTYGKSGQDSPRYSKTIRTTHVNGIASSPPTTPHSSIHVPKEQRTNTWSSV